LRTVFLATAALFASQFLFAQALPSDTDRLIATGKLWVAVKYFHPYLAYRDIDWDKALVDALPNIRAAKTSAEYAAAVDSMLGVVKVPGVHDSAPQRAWIHYGLAPTQGANPANFYSGFLIKAGSETAVVPMGGFTVSVPLTEPLPPTNAPPSPPLDRAYAETPYPSTELRILALYKIWGVIHYFFAYRDLMDEDWDELLPTFIPKFIDAKDARAYNLAICELLIHAADANTAATSPTLTEYFGQSPPGLRLRLVEKQAVITEVLDPAATAAGIRVGDVVKSVDGETLVDRFKRESQYISASTVPGLGSTVLQTILNGPEGSTAQLAIEDRAGQRKPASLKRSASYRAQLIPQRTGDAVKLLSGDVGYADLDRLPPAEVDAMFEKFRSAKAIIFDGRGSAAPAASAIASRLAAEQDVAAAIVTGPLTLFPDLPQPGIATNTASYFSVQTLPGSGQPKFTGKTVMLIDERTTGEAEHAGLLLEVANKTSFIGIPTAGADSNTSNVVVPGGVLISFSGQDIRHANGGKLQRLGIQPNVSAAPTLTGIRAGKDETLEKAIEIVSPPAAKRLMAQVTNNRQR
jgi:C-terminal processing protease CtpA/Prc